MFPRERPVPARELPAAVTGSAHVDEQGQDCKFPDASSWPSSCVEPHGEGRRLVAESPSRCRFALLGAERQTGSKEHQ